MTVAGDAFLGPLIVVDTNVLVYLVAGGAQGARAAALLRSDSAWAAPAIAVSELRNVLVGSVRRGITSTDDAKALYEDALLVLGGRIASLEGAAVLDAALECGLSTYDAEFVVLARELGVRLVTADRAVLAAAPDVAVAMP